MRYYILLHSKILFKKKKKDLKPHKLRYRQFSYYFKFRKIGKLFKFNPNIYPCIYGQVEEVEQMKIIENRMNERKKNVFFFQK